MISVGCFFGFLHFLNLLKGTGLSDVLPQVIWSCSIGVSFAVLTYASSVRDTRHCSALRVHLVPAIFEGKSWLLRQAQADGTFGLMVCNDIFAFGRRLASRDGVGCLVVCEMTKRAVIANRFQLKRTHFSRTSFLSFHKVCYPPWMATKGRCIYEA